jgi:hypothetical protein
MIEKKAEEKGGAGLGASYERKPTNMWESKQASCTSPFQPIMLQNPACTSNMLATDGPTWQFNP